MARSPSFIVDRLRRILPGYVFFTVLYLLLVAIVGQASFWRRGHNLQSVAEYQFHVAARSLVWRSYCNFAGHRAGNVGSLKP